MIDYLKPDIHDSLIQELQFIASQARIPEQYIRHVGAKEYCTDEEMNWLRNAKKQIRSGDGGMILYGYQPLPVPKKMLAIAATLTRNFIDARVYSLAEVLDLLESRNDEVPDCTVLVVPDLCIEEYEIPKRQLHKLTGELTKRFATNKALVGYVSSLDIVEQKYGANFANLLKSHFSFFKAVPEFAS